MPSATTAKFDQKLADILAAAAAVFAEEGFDRASIRAVAQRAGTSVPGLYYYVSSKDELLYLIQLKAFGSLVERFKAEVGEDADPAARLERLMRHHLGHFLHNLAELSVCAREIDQLRGDYRARIRELQHEYFSLAQGVFDDLARVRGSSSVDSRTAALAMFGAINWVSTWYRPGAGPSAEDLAADYSRLFLHGFLPPAAQAPQAARLAPHRIRPAACEGDRDV
jgi:AcrR family transcriptional regulator